MTKKPEWRTSSYTVNDEQCVEVAPVPDRVVVVRDTKDRSGPVLGYGEAAWTAFLDSIKAGELDLQ